MALKNVIRLFVVLCAAAGVTIIASGVNARRASDAARGADLATQPDDAGALLAVLSHSATRYTPDFVVPGHRMFGGQQGTAAAPQVPGEKTAGETGKNIKVLKNLPESQLIPVMQFMSASLGVNCAFCHVNTGGNFQFEKDDKREKESARQMIQLVLDTNTKYFNGRTQVSCFTCHRGREHPVGIVPLPLPTPEAPRPRPAGAGGAGAQREALPTAEQILTKYVEAVGGKAAIEKQKTRVYKGVQEMASGATVPVEVYESAPDKYFATVKTQQGELVTAFNGTAGWTQNPHGREDIAGDQLEILRRASDFYAATRLAEPYPKLRIVAKDKIGDRPVFVALSQVTPRVGARLYFDAESGLLLRIVTLMDTPVGRIPQQTDFEDYKDVSGVKMPFTIKQSGVDTRTNGNWTRRFSEINANIPVDESRFAAPVGK